MRIVEGSDLGGQQECNEIGAYDLIWAWWLQSKSYVMIHGWIAYLNHKNTVIKCRYIMEKEKKCCRRDKILCQNEHCRLTPHLLTALDAPKKNFSKSHCWCFNFMQNYLPWHKTYYMRCPEHSTIMKTCHLYVKIASPPPLPPINGTL